MTWTTILFMLLGYLVCNINLAQLIAKKRGVNLRAVGSRNPGASNVFMTVGPWFGVAVAVFDILKAAAVVLAARLLCPDVEYIGYLTGLGCLLGNLFPCFHRFRGGKGFATFVGLTLGVDWLFTVCLIAVVALITIFTGYIVLGTYTSIASYPLYVFFLAGGIVPMLIVLTVSLLIFSKHLENIDRLRDGSEMRLRLFQKR